MISRVFKRTVFAAVVAAGILAGTAAHATTLDDVYRAVAQGTRVEAADAKAAVDAMRASAAAAGAARDEAARTKKSLEAEVAALEEAVSAAQERVRERRAKLEKERASVEAVLASIERHEGLLTESVMKTQIGRSKAFMDDAPVSKTDGVARLRRHWVRALGAVAGSAGVRTVEDAVIYDAAGAPSRGTVTLYGPFAAKAGDGAWLRYLPSERAWRRLADDPGIPAGVVALDPSFGRLLAGYAERHSAWAWMKPAGVIGIFIGLVAAAALLLGFLRWTALALEERRVRRQLEDMENPREEVPVTAETVPEVSAPPKPVTLAFESPAIAAAGLPMPKYEIGRPTVDRVMTVPDFSFESPAAPAAAAPSAPAVSSIALARPVHRVPPQYPVKAKQQGIEGYVVMDLRINAEGRVEDVRVVREKPEGVFRASALRVVRRWAFMPPAEPAWQRLTIRYELEK